MSPSWLERITIMLSPNQVTVARFSRGVRPAIKDRQTLACPGENAHQNWQSALDVLRAWLTQPAIQAADAHVVLSNHFARYLLIPWNPDLVTGHEGLAFARARFLQVFGDTSANWDLRLSRPKPNIAGVASAVERPLLEALTAVIANSALRLRSIQPTLMATFNARTRMPAGAAWIAIAEPGRLLLGLLRGGEWHSLRSHSLNGHTAVLAQIIEQERLVIGIEPAHEKVFLHQIGEPSLDLHGLNVEGWLPASIAVQLGGPGQ